MKVLGIVGSPRKGGNVNGQRDVVETDSGTLLKIDTFHF